MKLANLLKASEDRYLTAAEREQVLRCARNLEAAARASAAVESAESAAIDDVIAELKQRYPRFGQLQPQAWERLADDLRLVVRHDVRALFGGDPHELDGAVLHYLKSILAAYRLSPAFVRDCFSILRDRLSVRLESDVAVALRPYLQRNVDVLGDVPEPAAAVV